jgi:hypothetical protein
METPIMVKDESASSAADAAPAGEAVATTLASEPAASETKPEASAEKQPLPVPTLTLDSPELAPSSTETAPRIDLSALETAMVEPARTEPASNAPASSPAEPQPELFSAEQLKSIPPKLDLPRMEAPSMPGTGPRARLEGYWPPRGKFSPPPPTPPETAASSPAPSRSNRFALLAASVALAAAFGAMIGGLSVSELLPPAQPVTSDKIAEKIKTDESAVVTRAIAQLRTELGALRTSIEASTRHAATNFNKVGERLDKIDRAQADASSKHAKAADPFVPPPRRDADPVSTGSISPPQTQPAVVPTPTPKPVIVQGWFVRDVFDGAALIEGRLGGMLEVAPGDTVPGIGRVEAIRRQDGRWVVVTPKGLILSMR